MVQRTGRKATIVAISHCDPPWTSALVIALATSSGFMESSFSLGVAFILRGGCLPSQRPSARPPVFHSIACGDRAQDGQQGN